MRYKICYLANACLVDRDQTRLTSDVLLKKLDGLTCHDDSALHYAELAYADGCGLRGGFPRLVLDAKNRLQYSLEVDSFRKLKRAELKELQDDFDGQITDGIGAGCFDELSKITGLAVEVAAPFRSICRQEQGTAWKPKASTPGGNTRRIAAVAKFVDALDANAVSGTQTRQSKKPSKSRQTKAATGSNLKKLFRLLDKVERDQLFEQIKAELEKCGNDLSDVEDGQLPYGNWSDPKLLRLLLNAGLPTNILDVQGHTLLIQAVANPKSAELLLKQGVDVNQVCRAGDATALMRAARLGKRKSVELLLGHGADPSTKSGSGKTALQLVDKRSRDRQAIQDLLEQAGGS